MPSPELGRSHSDGGMLLPAEPPGPALAEQPWEGGWPTPRQFHLEAG